MQSSIPDLLYYEEIKEDSLGPELLGLQTMKVRGAFVKYADALR